MEQEFWLKYGFKDNGELTCVRVLANSKPDEAFYYTEGGQCKPVLNTGVVRISKETIEIIKQEARQDENSN